MSLFCFLVVPLFVALRHSLGRHFGARKGIALAFALGSAAALLRWFIGDVIPAGDFGLLRWLHLFADRVAVPVLIPLGVWLFLRRIRGSSFVADPTDFALTWLVPFAALHAISWDSAGDPSKLVLTPLLWISIAAGLPRFLDIAEGEFGFRAIGAASAAVLVPLLATTASWAFFVHQPFVGFLSAVATLSPTLWWTAQDFASLSRGPSGETGSFL